MKRPSLLNERMKPTEWRDMVDRIDGPEELLAAQLDDVDIAYRRQFQAISGRKFAFDFQIDGEMMLLVEVQGGVHSGGRHLRGPGYTRDCEKLNLAVLAGYRVMWVTTEQVETGQALAWIERALMREERVGQ